MDDLVAGAWLGGTLDTSASVVAAGALISDAAMKTGVIVKFSQNALIGVVSGLLDPVRRVDVDVELARDYRQVEIGVGDAQSNFEQTVRRAVADVLDERQLLRACARRISMSRVPWSISDCRGDSRLGMFLCR